MEICAAAKSLIRQTGEAWNPTCDPSFTRQLASGLSTTPQQLLSMFFLLFSVIMSLDKQKFPRKIVNFSYP